MKSKFTLLGATKFFLLSAALIALVSAGVWLLLGRSSSQPGVTGGNDSMSDIITSVTERVIAPFDVRIHDRTSAAIPLIKTNVESVITKPGITSPDDSEDLDEIREWARQTSDAALAWASNAPAGLKRDTVAEMVCAHLAQSDPAQAVALAESFASTSSTLLENMVHQWADLDTTAARTYALSKPAGEPRDRLLSRVAFVLSKENPADAAKLVAEQISPGELQNEAAISVLHQWALRDTNAAAAWAQLFPDSALRDRAFTELQNIVAVPQAGSGTALDDTAL
jgi:hypothetical protein